MGIERRYRDAPFGLVSGAGRSNSKTGSDGAARRNGWRWSRKIRWENTAGRGEADGDAELARMPSEVSSYMRSRGECIDPPSLSEKGLGN